MQQLQDLQTHLNKMTVECVALNRTVADAIKLKSEPSILPAIDMMLETTLIKKMSIQLKAVIEELVQAGDIFEELYGTDE